MKIFMIPRILAITFLICYSATWGIESVREKKFADKGIWEIGGSISLSALNYVGSGPSAGDGQASININPFISYFIFKHIHLDAGPGFAYNYVQNKNANPTAATFLTIGPSFGGGYTQAIQENIFFDLTILGGFTYFNYNSPIFAAGWQDPRIILRPSLKIIFGQAVVNLGIYASYVQSTTSNISSTNYIQTGVYCGISFFL